MPRRGAQVGASGLFVVFAFASGTLVSANSCNAIAALDQVASGGKGPGDATCTQYLSENGLFGASCHWSFDYRDPRAKDHALTWWYSVRQCRTGAQSGPDVQVNHPDSYDLLTWVTRRGAYAVSVKDKGALGQTLVFVRFEPIARP